MAEVYGHESHSSHTLSEWHALREQLQHLDQEIVIGSRSLDSASVVAVARYKNILSPKDDRLI